MVYEWLWLEMSSKRKWWLSPTFSSVNYSVHQPGINPVICTSLCIGIHMMFTVDFCLFIFVYFLYCSNNEMACISFCRGVQMLSEDIYTLCSHIVL